MTFVHCFIFEENSFFVNVAIYIKKAIVTYTKYNGREYGC